MNTRVHIALLLLLLVAAGLEAQQWRPVGPDGGDVRSFAYDPHNPDRIFLGTSAGRLYLSGDGGATWSRFAHLGTSSSMVLDNIVIDPDNSKIMYVAAWSVDSSTTGDMFRTRNGGRRPGTVTDLPGKSVRAPAIAPCDPTGRGAGRAGGRFRQRARGRHSERK